METGHYLLWNLEALLVTFSPEQPLCWPSALCITNYNCKTPQHGIGSKTMMRLPNIIFSLTSSAVTLFLRQWSLISPCWRKNNFQASFFTNKKKCLIFWKCKRGANIVQALVLNSRHTFLDSVLSSILPQWSLPNLQILFAALGTMYIGFNICSTEVFYCYKESKNSSSAGWQNLEGIHLWEVCNSEEDDLIT